MKSYIVILAAGLLAFSAQGEAREAARIGSSCVIKSSSYVVYRNEAGFSKTAQDLNMFFASTKSGGLLATPSKNQFAGPETEAIRIEADVMSCAATGQPNVGIASIGGCDYVGCTGSVPGEFHSLPVGSKVSMTACGGGVRTTGTFQRAANGSWVMTGYQTEQVTHCDPMV